MLNLIIARSFSRRGVSNAKFCSVLRGRLNRPNNTNSLNFSNRLQLQICNASSFSGNMKLEGIYPPIVTNFTEDGKLDLDSLAANVKQWEAINFSGYVILGSTGECVLLGEDEKVELVTHLKYLSDKPVIAGSGCEGTFQTIKLSKKLAKAGADALMVVTPFYYKSSMNSEALVEHYTKVADASSVPIILYSVPPNTGFDLPVDVAVKLSSHPNIIGMKDSGGDVTKLNSLIYLTRSQNFSVLAGSTSFILPALLMGATGGVLGLANVLGEDCCRLFDLYKGGNMKDAVQLQHRLVEPNAAVTKMYGVPGVKHAMDLFGFKGGAVRAPLKQITEQQKKRVEEIFQTNGFNPIK